MSSKDLILGIDIGTTGAKCTFYRYDGVIEASSYSEYKTIIPQAGWSEQNPDIWWESVKNNLKSVFAQKKAEAQRVAVIGLSCTNAVTLVNKNGQPLYNAVNHHDTRAGRQVDWLRKHLGEERIISSTKNRLDKGTFALPTLRWLIDNKPDIMKECRSLLMPSGYIIQKLTGEYSINESRMDLTSLSNMEDGKWDLGICSLAEIPEHILPRGYKSTDIVGTVSREACDATGLEKGTPVTAGAVDTVAATIGAGATASGDVAITLGSSGRICISTDFPIEDKRLLNIRSAKPGQYILVQSTDNAGISLKWFRDSFGDAVSLKPGEGIYRKMDELASAAGAGAENITYLPYLTGEKSPIWNSRARGVFFNIDNNTGIGSFVRAILEGVAFSIRDCCDLVRESVSKTDLIPVGGGAACSTLWCQIFADVLNTPVLQLQSNETETLGDMIIAAQAIGIKEIPFDFGKTMAKQGKILYPDASNAELYDKRFSIYKQLYERVKDLFI